MVLVIALIVAVAIVCVIVAIFASAKQANDAALARERGLFMQAIRDHAKRALNELESVAISEGAYQHIGVSFDSDWVRSRMADRLTLTMFGHDLVAVVDANDRIISPTFGPLSPSTSNGDLVIADLLPALDDVRKRPASNVGSVIVMTSAARIGGGAVVLRNIMGRPAAVAAVAVRPNGNANATATLPSPAVVSVKLIDLAEISNNLQLMNLRMADGGGITAGDHVYPLNDPRGQTIALFAWTPKRPGAEIVERVVPFVIIALAGFSLLAGIVLRYMRRAAATISAGESRLRHLAMHDPLCGLPNRVYFGEQLDAAIARVLAGGKPTTVFYIDLDHFKDVNDTLGHPVGDDLLRAVAFRLSNTMREEDFVGRLGGDEFAVLSTAAPDMSSAQTIADRIIGTLCAPYVISGQNIVIGASIGVAMIDERVAGAPDIMRHVDVALYRAKNEGRNRASMYDTAMDADLATRKLLENDLRTAIETGGLSVAYQAQVNNSGERLVGVEALCRWTHPERGEIAPTEFIPIAENAGLITALGQVVLRQACLDGRAWPDITVSVNVSPLQFRRHDFVDVVERVIAETGFDPSRLELEVTESTLLGNADSAELAMFRLKALGARLALDDFGTGYSSLLYLRRFPFDKLKIDRGFVHSIERAADAAAIVHAIISLGRGLGMKVTAEGVETAEQHLFLRAAGVHSMQGYRFGKPCSAAEITARLAMPERYRVRETTDLQLTG